MERGNQMAGVHSLVQDEKGIQDWTVGQLLGYAADNAAEQIAIKDGDLIWTYKQLQTDSLRIAQFLLTQFRPRDHVAIWGANSAPWILYQMAAAQAGIVLVTLNPALRLAEVEALLRQSQAVGLIADTEYRGFSLIGAIGDVRPSLPHLHSILLTSDWQDHIASAPEGDVDVIVTPDDTALILYTSGTTGLPKGVKLHHRGIVNNALLGSELYLMDDGLAWLGALPFFHIGGSVSTILGCISRLGTHVILRAFEAGEVLSLIEKERIAWLPCVPTMAIAMMEHPDFDKTNLSSIEVIQTGGTTVSPEFVRRLGDRFDADVQIMFGQTEAGGVMCKSLRGDPVEVIAGTVGKPYPYTELKISDVTTGATLGFGQIGEIRIHSPYMTRGYFDNPAATAAAFDDEGFLRTGDLGTRDDLGYVRVTGRLKEMIIRGGENIYPREIEDRLGDYPGVAECAVIGVPHARWGEEVAVAIKCHAGATIEVEEARAFLLDRIARHKVPKLWQVVSEFPRTASGKIQKFALVDIFMTADEQKNG
ncbi:AMP-binding protein [Sphingobium sp. CR2-8]|uniref:class I adenylate-forming enzyme family protein n=1 Tax=Sphingobium sp. CR2-8 TaxID=1306534 RepID=UPI002DB6A89A|nr:AMP-binding protein [Sphingobium sp. CR2-8]MEC3909090.1 AMP-binding protein [Sphingobium sp. CR2-8]